MAAIPEREFIRGNRDGDDGRNETYTVCRVNVPMRRFNAECREGLHPSYLRLEVSPGWRCPAHARRNATDPASMADYGVKTSRLTGKAQELKVVHFTQEQPSGDDSTCVVCRLKVPRSRLVGEVKPAPNLHPGYTTLTTVKSETFVRGMPSVEGDNVNYDSACDLCLVS